MKDTKTVVIVGILIAVIAMSVAYAAFASNLSVTGTAKIDTNWDVEITSIVAKNPTGQARDNGASTTKLNAGGLSAIFDCTLTQPGDSITYTVTVENKGNINATLKSGTYKLVTPDDNLIPTGKENYDEGLVTFALSGTPATNLGKSGSENSTTTFDVIVTYNGNATTKPIYTSKKAVVELTYEQAA